MNWQVSVHRHQSALAKPARSNKSKQRQFIQEAKSCLADALQEVLFFKLAQVHLVFLPACDRATTSLLYGARHGCLHLIDVKRPIESPLSVLLLDFLVAFGQFISLSPIQRLCLKPVELWLVLFVEHYLVQGVLSRIDMLKQRCVHPVDVPLELGDGFHILSRLCICSC